MSQDSLDQDRQPTRMEILLAVGLASISIVTALVLWRANSVGSSASDAGRQGIISTVKTEASLSNSLITLYQEADVSAAVLARRAANDAIEESRDSAEREAAAMEAQYILPTLSGLYSFSSDPSYTLENGAFDLDRRMAELKVEADVDENPGAHFEEEADLEGKQRWLNAAAVILAFALFWLTAAEVLRNRARLAAVVMAGAVSSTALGLVVFVEAGVLS